MRRQPAQVIFMIGVVGCVSSLHPVLLASIDTRATRSVGEGVEGAGRLVVARMSAQTPSTWKTFTSAQWGVALDYPPGWTVDDDGDEVTFRSPNGTAILLGRTGTDAPSEPAPGRRTPKPECTTTTTAHDVAATVCIDARSLARRAVLVLKTRDGRQYRLALRTGGRDPQIFDAMVASVRRDP